MTTAHELRIDGMSCEHCASAVRRALSTVPGVIEAEVEIGSARVIAEASVDRRALIEAIEAEGYRAVP